MFFSYLSPKALHLIHDLLKEYGLQAGQSISASKSQLLFSKGSSSSQIRTAKSILHVNHYVPQFMYLRTSLTISKPTSATWNRVSERFQWKISSWKGPLLSPQGRTELL